MKKLISAAVSAVLAAVSIIPSVSLAEDGHYSPLFYFKAQPDVTVNGDGDILISREDISSGATVGVDVYIQDELLNCWYVAPKVKCADHKIAMNNVYNPTKDYGSGLRPYAYAEVNDEGELISDRHGIIATVDKEDNVINYTCMKQATMKNGVLDESPLRPYGEKSDDHPLMSFDMTIDPDIPAGVYEVYFLTEPEDYPEQRVTRVSTRGIDGGEDLDFVPRTKSIHIIVSDSSAPEYKLGDVNGDIAVDSKDASEILRVYACVSTGAPHGLSAAQVLAADVNRDNAINSADASAVLSYYSYYSTGGKLSMEDFLAEPAASGNETPFVPVTN